VEECSIDEVRLDEGENRELLDVVVGSEIRLVLPPEAFLLDVVAYGLDVMEPSALVLDWREVVLGI